MYKKSAAHKTLPLGAYVKVQNLSNGKETVVKVNDRGPFVKGRVIDLSYAAAREIDMLGPGVVDAKVVALGKKVEGGAPDLLLEYEDPRVGEFTIQVGAFRDRTNAFRLAHRLKVVFKHVDVKEFADEEGQPFYRVRVSKSKTLEQASKVEKKLEDLGFKEAFVVRL